MSFLDDLDEGAKRIEALSELDAKVLLVRICAAVERVACKDDWSDGMEEVFRVINAMIGTEGEQ